jgi:hypothetical protein
MSFQWLSSRIAEERERRTREARVIERLPRAFEELTASLAACVEAYTATFGTEAADLRSEPPVLKITVREPRGAGWETCATVEIAAVPALPGFRIETTGEPLLVEVGLLSDDKLFYKDGGQYISIEDLTRRILDRALFPHLGE